MDDLPEQGTPPRDRDPAEGSYGAGSFGAGFSGADEPAPTAGQSGGSAEPDATLGESEGQARRLRQSLERRRRALWATATSRGSDFAERWGRWAVAVALAVAVVLGLASSALPPQSPIPAISPSVSAMAAQTGAGASPTGAGASPAGPPGSSLPGRSPELPQPSESPTAEATAAPIPSQTSPTATITFNDLVLDPSDGAAASAGASGSVLTFSFTSDGPGAVSAEIVATSPMDSTTLCLTRDAMPAGCASGATPGVQLVADDAHSNWTVTLVSATASPPIVDVAISWPADRPSIVLSHGRFQGYPNPDSLRTLTATFKTRAAGKMSLDAAWPPATLEAQLTLTDVSGAKPAIVDTVAYPAAGSLSPSYSRALAAGKTYQVALLNGSPDSGRPDLTATIAFP